MGNIKKLYDALSSDYDNLGTYEEFEHKIRSEASRLKLYESIKDDYSNLGSYDEFSAKLGASTTNEEPTTPVQRPEPQKPQVDPTQGDAGRLHILPDGAVAQEGFNQSSLVETDTDWSSNTKQQLVNQAERDIVDEIASNIGGDAGEYFKSEYEKRKAQEELASAEQIPFRRARKDAVNKAEDKIKQAQIAIDNNPYYVNSLNEKAAGYDTQIANIDYLANNIQNTYERQAQLVDLEARGLGRPSYGVEGDEKLAQLDAARNFTNQAKDVTTAPLRYTKGDSVLDNAIINAMSAGKGMGDILKDPTFWDTNMSQRDNMAMLSVLKKVEKATGRADELGKRAAEGDFSGILSQEEMALLNAYAEMQSAKAERADNIARMYNVGKGAVQTAEFMLEMAMTAPFGNAISHKTSQAIGKYLLKKTVAMASDDIFKATLKWGATKGARLVAGQTGNFLSAAARVPFHWTTGEAISENALRVDENGKLISGIDAFVDGAMQSYKEIVTEGMGKATIETIGSALKVTGVSQILDVAAKTKPGEFVANIAKKVGNSGWAKATGYDGFGEEFLEEVDGAIWERVAGDKDALKDFFTVDNVLTTIGVLTPMAVVGGAATAANVKFAKGKMESATQTLINEMRRQNYKEEQINYYIDVMRTSTPKQIAEIFAPIINKSANADTALGGAASTISTESSGMDMFKAVKNCAEATIRYNSLDGSYKAQQEKQREDKKAELEQRYGRFYQIPTATNEKTGQTWETSPIVETAKLKDGRLVFIVSAPGEGGQMAAIDNRGNHTYITEGDIAVERNALGQISQARSTQNLDGYLSNLIMQKEKREETKRMETEIAEQTQNIVAEYAMGATVEVGTPEARVRGQVIGYKTEGDGVVIQTADGVVEKTYEELAAEKGTPIKSLTNEELDDAEVARMGIEETEYAKMQAFYKQYGKFWSEPKTDEEGNTIPPYVGMVTTDNGEFVLLSQQNGKMTVLSANGEQMTIDESEVKSRTAMPLSKFLANNEFTPPTIIEKTEEVASQEPVVEEKPKELPMKPDGSVDENALWTNDPAAWAEWNDQRRNDGGADSINYITKAIAREQETLMQLNEARDNEADFDKRNAIEQQMQGIRNRLATLLDVQQKYESAENEVQHKYETTETPSVEATPQAVENQGKVYNDIFVQTKVEGEKVRVLQEYMSQISNGSVPVEVVTKKSYEKVMRDAGCTDQNIEDVRGTIERLKPGQLVEGYQAAGKTFILAEGTYAIDDARSAYVHERQHVLNNSDPRFVNELADILGDKANALAVLARMSDAATAFHYAGKSVKGIANEIICRCMESAYKYQNFSVDLQNKGVPDEVISLIEKIDNEQRNTPNFSLSRRYDNVDAARLSDNQENVGDSEEVSRSVLGEQGLGSPEVGERGDGLGAAGAGAEESADAAADEDAIKRGTDFRIGKTPDSNGLSFEQKDEIEKTAGELEYGEDESTATQFSITAFTDAVGLNVIKDDGKGNVAFVAPNGQTFDANHPITAKDLKNIPDTSFGFMMADAKALGNVSPSKEWMLWDKYTLMLNAFLEKGSAENGGIENLQGTWQYIADTVYKTVATNSDSQYSFSLDITRVCKKNEAVINAISEMQRRLGYGITPGQIMDIYLSTIEAGYQVPCPVCYVFSRYIRNGKYATIMINGQRKYGSQLVDPRTLTEEQKKERIAFWLAEKEKIEAENEKNKKAITKANEDITTLLKDIDALSKQITDPKSNLSEEEKASILEQIHTLDARYRAALNVVSQSSLDSWITQFAIHQETIDGKKQWVLWEDTYKGFPVEAALDMRMTSTAMRLYPAIQRYRNSRGSGAGKEITFVSNNDIGDVPMALGSSAATKDLARPADISDEEFEEMKKNDEYADLKLGVKNLYRQAAEERDPKKRAALLKKARERFASASKYAKQQSLRGGQRMWSWSDNIERLAPDVFVNLMQLEMLGGALQSYSKQLEGIKLVASMNGYVNGSLMGKGNGYREVSEDEIEMVDGKAFVKDADFVIAEPGKKPIILKSPAYQHTDGKWYTLEFDDVVGIDAFGKDENGHHFKGLFDLNAKYDKAGNILVGMNDLHIRMAMMDDRVFFIIPWHSSGANQHILAQMYDYLGVEYDVKQSQDYTDVQGEKRYKAFGEKSEEKETKDGKKKEEVKITEHLVNFWADHYENAREINGYGKVAGKDFRCGIEGGIENSDGNGFISASQAHYRELRDAIFNGIKVQTGVDKNGKPKYTNTNVAEANPEWFNEIMNDEFLSQVYDKIRTNLGADGRMTSADSKSIYPYEYWDESSTYDTADINGVRYLEYCRRLGYKPKFCGKLDGKPAKDFGNFVDDKGYWKTLIDRRMYGIDKKFQDLSPVTAENFTTDLVDPVETAKEFIVTRVADEQGTQTIVDSALAKEESRGGVATVDYDLSMQEALDAYNGVEFKITEENFSEMSEQSMADMQKEINEVQFSIIGEVAALRDKSSEGVQRLNNLGVARDMESQLKPDWSTRDNAEALKIKVATGWERGADGLWRYEVADPKLRNPNDWLYKKKKLTIKDIVEDSELLRLYPTIGDIDIKKMTSKYDWGASYVAGKNLIELPFGALKDEIKKYEFWDEEVKQRKIGEKFLTFYADLLHEMQHAIQHREGFARGGTPATVIEPTVLDRFKELEEESNQITAQWKAIPKAEQVYSNPVARNLSSKSYDIANEVKRLMRRYRIGDSGYKRLAGENEANNAIRRMPFTPEQRRQTLLSATEDVDRANQIVIFRDVLGEGESVQFKVRTDEQREKLFADAKAHYGVTNNFNAAGYMLPDGSLLDFSEANDGGNPNERSLDHRDIEGIIMDEGTEYESRWMYIADFLNEGAIRLLPESAGINLSVAPTAEQRSKLFDFIYKYRGEVILEISDDRMNSAAYVEYNRGAAPARIFRDIDGYFRDGIIPQQDVQFKIRGAEESALEFEKNSLEDFRKEYRVPTPTTVVDIYDRNAVATALGYTPEELTDEYYDYLLDGYKKGGSGIFDPETKRITIFAKESVQNSSAVYNNIFHENTHGLIDKHPELLELGEWLWNNSEQKLRKSIKDKIIESKMYEGEEANEMLSGYTGFIMALGKAGVAYQKTPSELQKHWDLIFNAFGYEPEREDNNRRRGTWDNSGRVGSFRNRRDAEEQKYNKEESTQGLSAEERRQINEYLPGFEEVQFSVNSLGQPLTEGQQEFFANSKAVDKDGNLLVLYHGTPRAGFTEFKSGWFTTSKKDAISYSGDRKGRLFDPNEQYTPEVLTAGDFRLGYMTFDSEEDRAAFLAEHPTAESAMSEREYEDARMEAEDKEYDELTARREELKQIWDAYREYERGRFVESTIGEILDSPNSYTEEDLQRAMLAYDSNATMDSLDEAVNEEERKAMLITALAEANEETEGGIRDIIVATRVPRNGEGRTYNDTNARTYETYINVEKPYEIDAQGRGSEFVSGDIYKAVEEALADEQYDGVIIRNWRVGRYQELGDVVVPKYGSQVKLTSNNDPFSYQIGDEENVDDVESDVEYKIVTDKETLDRLNNEPTIKVYRAMQVIDGKLYPPMSAKVDGKLREPIELGQWEEAEERPDLADEDGFFKLDKGNKKDLKARYNPYFHTSYTPLNDQFSEAQDRPNLVTVEVKIPVSELSSGYKAEKAKDAVGEQEWKAGVIQGKLSGTRKVILSRWDRPVRIVPDSEVADVIVKMFDGKEITMPSNVVTPSLRAELEKRGIPFVETNNQGKTAEQVREELVDPQKIAKRKTPILKSKGTFANLGKAEEWAKKNLQGKSFTNKFTKEEVSVSGTSIKEMLSPKITKRIGEAIHMAALKSVPKFIETGIPGELHPDTHGRGFDVIRLYNAINIDGNIYRVKSTIKKLKEGDKFYTYELQEMELIEDTQSAAVGLDSKPILNSTNSITGANLLKGVKKTNSNELILPEEEVDFKITGTPTSEVVEKGLQLSVEDFSRLAGNIYESLPENVREEVLGNAARNNWDLQNAIYQIPARLAEKESWTKEDTQVAEAIAEKVTDAVLASEVKMKRPLTPNEALWMLYQSTNKTKEGDLFGAAREAVVANNLGFDEGVQFSINTEDELEGIDKIIADGKMAIATANQESADAFAERINKINGNLSQLRKAAAAQREYDQNTIKEIVNVASALLEKGMLSPSTRREVVKLLNITRDAVGKKDLTISANRLMDLMIANQLRYGEDLLNKYLKTRDKKVDARGIEVQGVLDINGQQIMQTLRGTVNLTPEEIDDKIAIAENNLDSPSETIKRNAENDLIALNLAKQFADEVRTNKQEEKDLRDEIKGDKVLYDEGRISKEEHLQFVKEAHETIREMRLQRVKAYQSLTDNLAKMMKGSIEKAQRLREAEKERVEKIHHYANSDMQGMQSDEHTALEKDNSWWNNSLVRFFLKPLATFDQMLRGFAPKSRSGEGYLWNHFMSGWMKATENEFKGVQAAHEVLDAKAREVFGKKAKRWSDIFSLDRDLPTASVKFWDGGEMKDHKLTQGNLLYIYMVNKMADGRMKLRKMGITEEDVVNIVRNLDPRFIELADWLQSDFLPSLREKYNAVHEKMFGAPMAAIDNYFPIRVLANARVREVNLGEDESNSKPSTITGSIIKRTKNSKALDVLGSNAFDVILEHIQDMEHWASFAELNRDLNTLLSYKKFRNRVQNMTGIYGAGKTAWNNFRTVAEIATGVYKPAAKHDSIDKLAVNLAKGVTGAKISFRVYTAIKQLLSMPAFVSDANIAILAKNMATPWVAWNWAMENLPMFEKRWKSRQAGDSRLMQTESDYKIWKTKFVETASRLGMTPNALVDAVTVAIGARSIYETKVKQYIKDGYSQDKAEEKAKRDATILFNESQQSNEGAFLSAVQVDRTAGAVSLSAFRNSSMGYQRMYVDAIRNLGNSMRKGYKEESIEFMKKQMIRDGLTEEQATRAAERIFNRSFVKSATRIATFGFLVQFAWNLGAAAPYILYQLCKLAFGGGDDDEELVEPIKDAAVRALVGAPIEGLTGGSVLSNIIGNVARGEKISNVNTNLLPVVSDIEKTLKMLDNDWVAASNEMLNILVQAGIGVNPQTFTDIVVAVVDACNGDLETSKEAMLCMMRVLQVPQSQIEKVYIDEIGFTADKGLDMRIEEFAKRYAEYKVNRGAPMTGWLYSDETEKKREDAYIKKFLKTAEEAKRTKGNEEAKDYFEYLDGTYKEIDTTLKTLRKNAKEAYQEGEDELAKDYVHQLNEYLHSPEFVENAGLYQKTKATEKTRKAIKDVKPKLRDKVEDAYLKQRNKVVEELREKEREEK